jgi:hypothetical protein
MKNCVCAFADTHTTDFEQLQLFKVRIYINILFYICQNVKFPFFLIF